MKQSNRERIPPSVVIVEVPALRVDEGLGGG